MLFLKKRRKLLLCVSCILLTLLLLFAACAIYVSDYYPADEGAIEAFSVHVQVEERQLEGGIAYGPSDAEVGFIFYPGGKVDHTAYIPLMRALAARGVLCVLLEMPFRLAVLDINAASGVGGAISVGFPLVHRRPFAWRLHGCLSPCRACGRVSRAYSARLLCDGGSVAKRPVCAFCLRQ